jgi:hypothetical protein
MRENGTGISKPSHARDSRHADGAQAANGTTTAWASWAAARQPGFATPRGPRGPSTANAASHPRRSRWTTARSPSRPPRELDPRSTPTPKTRSAPASTSPSVDRLTSATVRRRNRCASSGIICPCQRAYTHGRCAQQQSAGCCTTCTRRVTSQSRATKPMTQPATTREQCASDANAMPSQLQTS